MTPEKVIIGNAELWHGDCEAVMPEIYEHSIDSIVTDPPYGLSFMGHHWDHGIPGVSFWQAMLRVAKPGSHLLAFGGTRTYHRMACAIEDAGWDVRDCIMWLYGSGFPKSHNGVWGGTALKPAYEPIIMARKPLIGTVAANFAAHGVGGLNIDGCRIRTTQEERDWQRATARPNVETEGFAGMRKPAGFEPSDLGRWPANIIHDGSDEVMALFPDASGQQGAVGPQHGEKSSVHTFGDYGPREHFSPRGDGGSAARFFYCAKASKEDRNEGCGGLPLKTSGMVSNTSGQHITRRDGGAPAPTENYHPTVKPTDLMRYLCRLVTPMGGIIFDPFAGSGSTGKAALKEGFRFVGIEQERDFFDIACRRIEDAQRQQRLVP